MCIYVTGIQFILFVLKSNNENRNLIDTLQTEGILLSIQENHRKACTVYFHYLHVRLLRVTLNINQSIIRHTYQKCRLK